MKEIKEYVVDKVAIRLIKEEAVYTTENTYNFSSPGKIAMSMMTLTEDLDKEHFYVLNLNTKNTLQNINLVTIGTTNSGIVAPMEVFKSAILSNATSVVLVHNHPSGETTPSKEDVLVTERLVEAGKILGIQVLDHIILGNKNYNSFREQGLMN